MAVAFMLLLFPVYGLTGVVASYAFANLAVYVVLWRHVRVRTGIDCSVFALMTGLSPRPARVEKAAGAELRR